MPERWRAELKKIDGLHPDENLVQRAADGPRRPMPEQRTSTRIATIVFALLIAGAGSFGAYLVVHGVRSSAGSAVGSSRPVPNADVSNGDLLYAKKGAEGWNLFSANPSTSEERQLTHGTRDYGSDWSPDSSQIVYDTDDGDIVIANADGTDPVTVGTGTDPAWSPDGRQIAYAGDGGSIWVMGVDGSDAHPITDGAAAGTGKGLNASFDSNPVWSPNGRSIAYSRELSHRSPPVPGGQGQTDVTLEQVRVWHEGSPGSDTMLTDAYTDIGELDWSPDGSTIVFTGAPTLYYEKVTNGSAWPRVLVIPADGGKATPITPDNRTWTAGATWSPDGRWIAYVDDNHAVVVMRPDGSDRRQLAIDPGDDEIIGPSWGTVASSGSS